MDTIFSHHDPTPDVLASLAMSAVPKTFLTPDEYLAIEREAPARSEYFNGRMFSMAGGKEPHNLISANVLTRLTMQFFDRPCRAYGSDQRIRVEATDLMTYPDVSAVCGELQFHDSHQDTLLNPQVLVEVLSKSSERYDRGDKFANYQLIPSLQHYLLIAQRQHRIEHFERQADDSWLLRAYTSLDDVVELASMGCRLVLREVYDKVELRDE